MLERELERPIYSMQNHKEEEKEILNYFLSTPMGKRWYNRLNVKETIETESPDFIFLTQKGTKIGLEVTRFLAKTKHGQALQSLKNIGNKICNYSLKYHNLPISIIVDKFDKRIHQATTKQEWLNALYNPGFVNIFSGKEIKAQIEPFIDNNLEKLKNFPRLVKKWINLNDEFLCFTISGFPNINGQYDCFVNNACFSLEDPFEQLQQTIDNKNEKYNTFIKKCDECNLLVFNPSVSEGNYCHFTNKIKQHKFISRYKQTFFCGAYTPFCINLK